MSRRSPITDPTPPDDPVAGALSQLAQAEAALAAQLSAEPGRKRGALQQKLHEIRRMRDPGYRYFSQAGQDATVDRILGGKRNGTFVDLGGYDGITGSNTAYFEYFRGWTGLLVEPDPDQFRKAAQTRKCSCLEVAVAASDGEGAFLSITSGFTQMSGMLASYDAALLRRVRADPRHRETTRQIAQRSLSRILTEAGLPDPDFVSLDIEGGELAALAAFPFDRHAVRVWAIENNRADPSLRALMTAQGYDLVEYCGVDEIYLRRA